MLSVDSGHDFGHDLSHDLSPRSTGLLGSVCGEVRDGNLAVLLFDGCAAAGTAGDSLQPEVVRDSRPDGDLSVRAGHAAEVFDDDRHVVRGRPHVVFPALRAAVIRGVELKYKIHY